MPVTSVRSTTTGFAWLSFRCNGAPSHLNDYLTPRLTIEQLCKVLSLLTDCRGRGQQSELACTYTSQLRIGLRRQTTCSIRRRDVTFLSINLPLGGSRRALRFKGPWQAGQGVLIRLISILGKMRARTSPAQYTVSPRQLCIP